jgi:hypothetical protein
MWKGKVVTYFDAIFCIYLNVLRKIKEISAREFCLRAEV